MDMKHMCNTPKPEQAHTHSMKRMIEVPSHTQSATQNSPIRSK